MELRFESGKLINTATESDIRENLQAERFAVLSADPDTYIQCAKKRRPPGEYDLEYQAGSLEEHYRAIDRPIDYGRVLQALCNYLKYDASWRDNFRWEKMSLSPPPSQGKDDSR
ncbi:MAG: hypothetical protein E6K70_14295 [Planctomycetota bacterium]|nr:MAG: hypothetical protein E6K70_14295 [Planctomycetota bacterium]